MDAVARLRAVPIAVSLLERHACIMSNNNSLLPVRLLSKNLNTILLNVLQVKALAVSTAATAAVGTAAVIALNCIGLPSREVANVSSWQGAILVMQQHRVCFQAWVAVRMQSQSEARIHHGAGHLHFSRTVWKPLNILEIYLTITRGFSTGRHPRRFPENDTKRQQIE